MVFLTQELLNYCPKLNSSDIGTILQWLDDNHMLNYLGHSFNKTFYRKYVKED